MEASLVVDRRQGLQAALRRIPMVLIRPVKIIVTGGRGAAETKTYTRRWPSNPPTEKRRL